MSAASRHVALALMAVLALGLGACATAAPPQPGPVAFANAAQVRFDAAEVQFVDNYRPTLAPPNVEHQFNQTPAAAVRDWTRARLAAAGASGVVRVIVHDASVVEVKLPTRPGFGGLLYDEQDTRYDGALEVSIEYSGQGRTAQTRSRVVRTQTLPESATLNQRTQVYSQLMQGLMDDFDRQMQAGIRQYMGAVIR